MIKRQTKTEPKHEKIFRKDDLTIWFRWRKKK